MEAVWNKFNALFKGDDTHKHFATILCAGLTGAKGEITAICDHEVPNILSVIYEEIIENESYLSVTITVSRVQGFSIDEYRTDLNGVIMDSEKMQEAEARCELLNAELIH